MRCCVPFCKNTAENAATLGISFHRFPSYSPLRAAWLCALGKQDTPLADSAVVCSQHFLNDDLYEAEDGSIQVLGTGAIPSTVQVFFICLDADTKMFLMSKQNLDEAYKQLTGYPVYDGGNLKQTACMHCAQRLRDFSNFRDKSLRVRELMVDLVKKHEIVTKRHIKMMHKTKNQLQLTIVKATQELDHCDEYIQHPAAYRQAELETFVVEGESIYFMADEDMEDGKENDNTEDNYDHLETKYTIATTGNNDLNIEDIEVKHEDDIKTIMEETYNININNAEHTEVGHDNNNDNGIQLESKQMDDDLKKDLTKHEDDTKLHKDVHKASGKKMPLIKRKSWDHDAMIRAVNAVRSKQMGYLKASKHFGVPKGTLARYVKKDVNAEVLVKIHMGRAPAMPDYLEAELEKYCKELDQRFYGLCLKDIKQIAFQLAITNNIKHPFSLTKATAGEKWLRGFISRHPDLSVRTPEAVSAKRVKGFNPVAVSHFFDLYEAEIDKIKSPSHRVYTVDETGITVVQHERSEVISVKGKNPVGALTSLERGKLITIVTCMNASGSYVPPLIIFPRKNMAHELMDGAPAGSIGDCHPSGWIQTHLFTKWFRHFINFTKPSKDDPIILILDGQYTHTRNIDVINLGRENNVTIVCLPPHCTHLMQPMDVAFMTPLKAYYSQEIETWLRNNPGRTLTNKYVARLFGIAYEKAATMSNSVNGFRKTGLVPCNRNILTEIDFTTFNYRDQGGLSEHGVSNENTGEMRHS